MRSSSSRHAPRLPNVCSSALQAASAASSRSCTQLTSRSHTPSFLQSDGQVEAALLQEVRNIQKLEVCICDAGPAPGACARRARCMLPMPQHASTWRIRAASGCSSGESMNSSSAKLAP